MKSTVPFWLFLPLTLAGLPLVACGGQTTDPAARATATDPAKTVAPPVRVPPISAPAMDAPDEPRVVNPPATMAMNPENQQVLTTDVSILYPLPERAPDALISASTVGGYGQLFPKAFFDQTTLPAPHGDGSPTVPETLVDYARLRLVAVRLDPCGTKTADNVCEGEIRVVFQSIKSSENSLSAEDDALHAFYTLPSAEVVGTLRKILAAKGASGQVAATNGLGVHPISSVSWGKLACASSRYFGAYKIARPTGSFARSASGRIETRPTRSSGLMVRAATCSAKVSKEPITHLR
jgi:hypothetical protein